MGKTHMFFVCFDILPAEPKVDRKHFSPERRAEEQAARRAKQVEEGKAMLDQTPTPKRESTLELAANPHLM